MIKVIRVANKEDGGKKGFEMIQDMMKKDELTVFGLATGSTPITLYQHIVASDLDFSDKISINLDEYVGLASTNPQSYHYFMRQNLFEKKPFKHNYLPDGLAKDSVKECERYDDIITNNPIDVQILGIGENGHIGFNEPGSPFDSKTRKVSLTDSTIEANKRFFDKKEDVPTYAYSMGIASIMKAKKIILLAFGENKAEAIFNMIEGAYSEDCPASALQKHPDVTVIVDESAAQKLTK